MLPFMALQRPTADNRTALARTLWETRITQAEVARALGVTDSAVSRWTSGEPGWPIPEGRIQELAELLGVSPDEIIGS